MNGCERKYYFQFTTALYVDNQAEQQTRSHLINFPNHGLNIPMDPMIITIITPPDSFENGAWAGDGRESE